MTKRRRTSPNPSPSLGPILIGGFLTMWLLDWLFGRKRKQASNVTASNQYTAALDQRPSAAPAQPYEPPSDAGYWARLDADAVDRFTTANIRRIEANARKDTADAARWQAEYDKYFALHREYRARQIEAESRALRAGGK